MTEVKTEVKTKVKAIPGDRVMVENYRSKYKEWEVGEVTATTISLDKNGGTHNSYDVWVERPKTLKRPWRNGYRLSVGDKAINPIEK